VGFAARLFFAPNRPEPPDTTDLQPVQTDIENRLAAVEPDVEVLLCERVAAEKMRLVIDHPEGVDLALCERVTGHLGELLRDVGLEVSSPGPERPLTKSDHFRRYIGRRVRVRTREALEGQKSFTGELVDASDVAVTVAAGGGVVSIPYGDINRGNLVAG